MEAVAPERLLAGRYELRSLTRSTGPVTVWHARDGVLARDVEVKILREDLASDPSVMARFLREASTAACLTHPNIVSVFDAGTDDRIAFVVVERFPGEPLPDRPGPHMEPGPCVALTMQVLAALAYAHDRGILHGRLEPGCVLVGVEARAKVGDFGLSRAAYGRAATTGEEPASAAAYLAPEQAAGEEVGPSVDVYSAGALLYRMLTGRPPFEADSEIATVMLRLVRQPRPPGALRAGIPKGLEDAVLRALARHPEERFASARDMLAAIEPFAGSPGRGPRYSMLPPAPMAAAAEPGKRMERPSAFRSWMLVPLALVAVAGAVIAGGLALGHLQVGGPLGITGAHRDKPPSAPSFIPIAGVRDFDPQGADHQEHHQQANLAVDRNAATAWPTDHYATADFGNLKSGVGLWLDLGGAHRVERVTITSPIRGWSFQVRAGATPSGLASFSAPLPASDRATSFTVGPSGTVTVDLPPVRASGLLIWITRLAPNDGRYAASIAEVSVTGGSA